MKEISRQRRWQLERKALGLCSQCGKPRPKHLKNRCEKCQKIHNERRAKARRAANLYLELEL